MATGWGKTIPIPRLFHYLFVSDSATNPSAFDIQFFVNDLSKPSSSVFTPIGRIAYRQNENILLQLIDRPPTDGILFRGGYQILTIAVFGEPSDLRSVRHPPQLVPEVVRDEPPHDPLVSHSSATAEVIVKVEEPDVLSEIRIRDESETTGLSERSPVSDSGKQSKSCLSVDDLSSPTRSNASLRDVMPGSPLSSAGLPDPDESDSLLNAEMLENISPDASPLIHMLDDDDADSISDGDLPIGNEDDDELEQISSDDDPGMETSDPVVEEVDDIAADLHDDAPDHLIFFNPAAACFHSLPDVYDPCRKHRISLDDETFRSDVRRLVRDFDDPFEKDLFHVLTHGADAGTPFANIVNRMKTAIDLSVFSASQSEAGKTRQFKSAIKILIILIRQSEQLLQALFDSQIISSLLCMFNSQLLNLPFRLLIFSLVDALIDDVVGMRLFLLHPHASGGVGTETGYEWLLRLFLTGPCTRLLVGMTALLQKCNFFAALIELNEEPALISKIKHYLITCGSFMKQQNRLLPVSAVFERRHSRTDSRILFRWFENTDFVSFLTHHAEDGANASCVIEIISLIVSLPDGLSFLSTSRRTAQTNKIIRTLFVNGDSTIRSLTSDFSFLIHANHLVLSLHHIACYESDSNDFEPCLHKLYMLLFNAAGSKSLVHVLSDDHLLKLFLSVITSERVDSRTVFDCLVDILMEVIVHRRQDVAKLFSKNGKRLQKLADNTKLLIIRSWIEPLQLFSPVEYNGYYYDRIMKYITAQAEVAEDRMSPQLVGALRLLLHACVPQQAAQDANDLLSVKELKSDYAILQTFSCDGLHVLLNLVDFMATSQANCIILLSKMSLSILLQQLLPAVQIIRSLLHQLMDVRRSSFSDCTPVPILMRVHSLLCSNERIAANPVAVLIRMQVIEILRLYVSVIRDQEEPIDLKKSMWCKMLSEVMKFTLSCPMTAASGLRILNALVPDPLIVALDQTPVSTDDTSRQLWSLHLNELETDIESLVSSLCCSASDVQSELCALIARLCDLSVSQADACCTALLTTIDEIQLDAEPAATNWLILVTHLMEAPSFRTAIAHHLFHEQRNSATKLITLMQETRSSNLLQLHLQLWSQLCSLKNGLECENSIQNQANLLPAKDVMSHALGIVLEVMHVHAGEPAIAVAFLSVLISFAEHEHGLIILKKEMTDVREQETLLSLAHQLLTLSPSNSLCATHVSLFIALSDSLAKRGVIAWHLVQRVRSLLSASPASESAPAQQEAQVDPLPPHVILPRPEPLSVLFARRQVPPTTARKLLKLPASPPVYQTIDLLSLSKSLLTPQFDLVRALESSLPSRARSSSSRQVTTGSKRKADDVLPFDSKKQMVAPMRSRAYTPRQGHSNNSNSGGGGSGSHAAGRSVDPFRSRPPNTSRPPSMHVDDFVAMEQRDSTKKNPFPSSSSSMKQQKVQLPALPHNRNKRHALTMMRRDDGPKRNVR